jgi:murein DD-endopeptidase MepM/ murein hydrolase activator NlpD
MLPRSISALLAIAVTLTAPHTAQAHDGPPIQIRFPLELGVATHHNDWRSPRSGGRRHQGNDLMAPKLTEVYAAADGVVTKLSTSARAGRYLIIEHAAGWETYYIHLNNDTPGTDDGNASWLLTVGPGIEEGTRVEAGQLIGWVGDSGNAEGSGPHLHFELHHNGAPVNPYQALVEAEQLEEQLRDLLEAIDSDPPVTEGLYSV